MCLSKWNTFSFGFYIFQMNSLENEVYNWNRNYVLIAYKNISWARWWMLNYLEKFTPLRFSQVVPLCELMDLCRNPGHLSLFLNAKEWKYGILSFCCTWSRSVLSFFFLMFWKHTDMKTNVCLAQQEIVKYFTNTRWDFNNVCKNIKCLKRSLQT